MEYPLEFKVVSNGVESAIQTISFQEYGIYTLVIDTVENPVFLFSIVIFIIQMKIVEDKKGHNYYIPFYFYLSLTIGFICLVISVLSVFT